VQLVVGAQPVPWPKARPATAVFPVVGAVSVSGPFTVSAKLAAFDARAGVEAFAISDATTPKVGETGNGPVADTAAVAQL
jgi:hypothetical protein